MEFNEYQKLVVETAVYRDSPNFSQTASSPTGALSYCALGLAGEAGEFANKIKKIIRGDLSVEDGRVAGALELGDALWYLSESARNLGYSLDDIARMNIEKLSDRKARGTIAGNGDAR